MGGGFSTMQLVMVGLDNSGKTALLYHMKFGHYINTQPTIGFNRERVKPETGNAKGTTFQIWDIGGQDKIRPLWRSYLRSAQAVVFVVDSADEERLEEARMELVKLIKFPDSGGGGKSSLPVLVLANKQDLPRAGNTDHIEKTLALHEFVPNVDVRCVPVCGVTGEGLAEAIDTMYDMILKKRKRKS